MSVFRNIIMLLNREIPTEVLIKRGMSQPLWASQKAS